MKQRYIRKNVYCIQICEYAAYSCEEKINPLSYHDLLAKIISKIVAKTPASKYGTTNDGTYNGRVLRKLIILGICLIRDTAALNTDSKMLNKKLIKLYNDSNMFIYLKEPEVCTEERKTSGQNYFCKSLIVLFTGRPFSSKAISKETPGFN